MEIMSRPFGMSEFRWGAEARTPPVRNRKPLVRLDTNSVLCAEKDGSLGLLRATTGPGPQTTSGFWDVPCVVAQQESQAPMTVRSSTPIGI